MPLSGSVRYMGKSGAFAGTESTLGQTRRRRLPLTYPGFGCVFFFGRNRMVHFVGAGPGAADLITLRGAALLETADQVIYAGSLVNPALLERCRADCRILNSAVMTLEEVIDAICAAEAQGRTTVRLHTGDPSVYGAVREQMDRLEELKIPYDVTPGASSFCAAAAALRAEYTLPGISQTLILTRMEGRTPVPEREQLRSLAQHGSSMAVFLSAGMLTELQAELMKGAYTAETPAALVYKASWPEEMVVNCTVGTLAESAEKYGIHRTALVLVGEFLAGSRERSRLYDPAFTTGYRKGTDKT